MKKVQPIDLGMSGYDELFMNDEERQINALPHIFEIPIELIDDFPDHPFQVRMDEDMQQLVDSVTLNGNVTQEAYKDLVYDLTVVLDSIQVTPDEAKTDDSYVTGVNGAGWGATAAKSGDTISWT